MSWLRLPDIERIIAMKKIITETKTVIVNTRNFAKIGVYFTADEVVKNEDGIRHFLTRNDGEEVVVDDSAFKRYYKTTEIQVEVEIEVEEPKAETKPLTKHQQVAAEQLENAYNWIVGGYMNAVQDGDAEEMPSVEDLFNEVMDEATTHLYGKGMCSQKPAPAAMNFAGKKFLVETLVGLFKADDYEVPESCTKIPEKRTAIGPRKNIKGNPENVAEDEVVMRAFTGMLIGVFKIAERGEAVISVQLANGTHMDFDANTGREIGARNPRFANRIEL